MSKTATTQLIKCNSCGATNRVPVDEAGGTRRPVCGRCKEPLVLQAHPQAFVDLAGGIRRDVLGRPAVGDERDSLWQRWRELDKGLDNYAARRSGETAVVVLEPRP